MSTNTAFTPTVRICQAASGTKGDKSSNVIDDTDRFYANCGRWQLGHTDFVVISKYDILLCSWLKFGSKAGFAADQAMGDIQKKMFIENVKKDDPELAAFFENAGQNHAYVWERKSIKHREDPYKLSDKLLVIVPDCHISMFKGWTLDGFCSPRIVNKKQTKSKNGYPLDPVSLEKDFISFLKYARKKASCENVIHVGDLVDYWHTQWMFELAFDIYRDIVFRDIKLFNFHKSTSSNPISWDQWRKNNTRKRFPVELLAANEDWQARVTTDDKYDKSQTSSSKPHYDWWRHFHKYLGVSFDSPIHKSPDLLMAKVAKAWPEKMAPHDVMAIVWWGLDLEWYATPLVEDDFDDIQNLFEDLADADNWFWSLFKSTPTSSHPGYSAITSFKNSMINGDKPLNFLDLEAIKQRIYAQYTEELQEELEKFTPSNYVRGNHDCEEPNEYLHAKFGKGVTNEDALEEIKDLKGKKGKEGLDDSGLNLPPEITIKCGEQKAICIEHGDAWDRQNNGRGYYKFDVGTPWADAKTKGFVETTMYGGAGLFDNGGYHEPKSSYNKEQLESPGSKVHSIKKWVGDAGLDPSADLRMQAIFKKYQEKGKEIRVVVMGHTHLPRLEAVDLNNLYRLPKSMQ